MQERARGLVKSSTSLHSAKAIGRGGSSLANVGATAAMMVDVVALVVAGGAVMVELVVPDVRGVLVEFVVPDVPVGLLEFVVRKRGGKSNPKRLSVRWNSKIPPWGPCHDVEGLEMSKVSKVSNV